MVGHYYSLNEYLLNRFGEKIYKLSLDLGLTCPNRDGTLDTRGCIFCHEGSSHFASKGVDISLQIEKAKELVAKKTKATRFIAYFQSYTNTYAPVGYLEKVFSEVINREDIVAISIGTRPDCINEEVCELIASYKQCCDVWVELGLQTASDRTADIINRGYHKETFERAMELLKKHGIDVCIHLIVGLPGESMEDIVSTCRYLSDFKLFGIKIHSIYVMRDTRLCEMYERGEYAPPSIDFYIDAAVYILTHIHPATVVHRLTGDCPDGMLVAPEWNKNKHLVIDSIVAKMMREGLSQGCR